VLLEQEQGGELDFGWSLSTWEAKDGRAFDFTIQRYQNGSVYETVQGDAVLGPDGAGTAAYAEPVARTVDLPPGTMFPTDHTFAMLEAARNGALPVYSTVFDASSEHDGLTAVSTVLGARVAPDAPASLDVPLLRDTRSWRLLLAYFPPTGPAELPDTEVALRLFANGIADDFVFDYGDFALRARLTDLTALPDPDC
jgi:hypothetical protein